MTSFQKGSVNQQQSMKDELLDYFEQPKGEGDQASKPKNMKNIYIQKLTKLFRLSRENLIEVEGPKGNADVSPGASLKRETKSSININGGYTQSNDKLQKNRESARKARKRKKLYVKLLEKQVQKYKDIAQQGKELQRDVSKFMSDLKQHITKKKELASLKPVATNNMVNLVTFSTQFQETDVAALVTNYQNKFGPSSSQRFDSMDASLKEIREMFLPYHISNILNSESTDLIREMEKNNGGSALNIVETSGIKEEIDRECQKINHCLKVLKQTIDMSKEELKEINHALEEMKQQHGSSETCRFLLMVQEESSKHSNVAEFREFLDQLNFDTVRQNNEERYSFIFKDDLKRSIMIRGKASQDLLRRMNIYLDREIV